MTPSLGVCYYPEHWPESQWAQDAKQMQEIGLSWVRIGEFAWSQLEPKAGYFKWAWLDRAIDVFGSAGLKVILGTPTATPPRWMLDKYPDMLAVDKTGQTRKFGSRRHYCFSHLGYLKEARRITKKLAERYGGNPHIQAWQTDNEYGCHDTVISYSQAAKHAFQKWLKAKYKNCAELNTAWGNIFWSMEYEAFSQIDLPNHTVTEANPAHRLDFRRFSSDQVATFNKSQCDVLRDYSDKPIIHNYMGRITNFDHFKVGADLDIASWDSYPLGFLEDRSDQGDQFKHDYRRQGDPDFQAFHHDLYRAVGEMRSKHSRWWVMEQQPGPVNWAPYNPAPLPGMVRLWTWEAIAHGAEVVSYFRWRQAPFAQEQMHAGLQRPDGEWADGGLEAIKIAAEIKALPELQTADSPVAIVFDYASAWAWEIQPHGQNFNYFKLVYDFYRNLRRLGLSVDIIPSSTVDFGERKLILIPGLMAWTDSLKAAIKTFNGHIVIGPRSGSKTKDFATPASLPPHLDGFKGRVLSVESLRPTDTIALEAGGAFQIWRELIETSEKVIENTHDGKPAIISKGKLTYLAGWPDDEAMIRILEQHCHSAKIITERLEGGYRRRDIGVHTLHMNYGPNPIKINDNVLGVGDIEFINNTTKISLINEAGRI